MGVCIRQYEPHAKPAETHTCDRPTPHWGNHHCPRCGVEWRSVPGTGPNIIVTPGATR